MDDAALAFRHRNRHAPDLALGADLDGLPVAGGPQRQGGGKPGSLDKDVDLATARRALQIAENIAAGFAPVAGNAVTIARDIAAQVELVAVAGAMQILLQTEASAVDLVVGLAPDALDRTVGKRHCSIAGPRSVKTDKRAGLSVAGRHRQHQCGADTSSFDRLSKQAGTKQFHIEFSHLNRRSLARGVSPHRRFSVAAVC
jgi:hypothetical protein